MTEDARFADGAERPLRLRALDGEDLGVISALVQDAVFAQADMNWVRKSGRFAILLNRFRWERGEIGPERVRAMLVIEDVVKVQTRGLPPAGEGVVLSLLSLSWTATDEVSGRITLTLAGDGEIALDVEVLEVVLQDVSRPYAALSGRAPDHPD